MVAIQPTSYHGPVDRQVVKAVLSMALPALTIGTDFIGAVLLVTPIENEFGTDITTTQWVFNIYALAFAMTLVSAGRLADMFGRRKLLLIGLTGFIASSLGCAFAPSVGWLIAARALQGVCGATMWPCILAIPVTSVAPEKQGTTMGLIMGCATLGNETGPLLAGTLGALGDWRWFFGANAILGVASVVLVLMFIPAHLAERKRERIDFTGMIVLTAAILALLYAMDVGGDWGWGSWRVVGLLVLATALFATFPLIERHVTQPMVQPRMLRNGPFMIAIAANGLMVPSIFLLFLYASQYLSKVEGWTDLAATFGVLPVMVCISVTAVFGGRLYDFFGPRVLLMGGYTLTALGCLAMLLVSREWGYPSLVVVMVLIGIGAGACIAPATTAAVAATEAGNAGLAGGLSFMSHLGMGAIGVAVSTAVLTATSARQLSHGLDKIGMTMSDADQRALNGGSPRSPMTQDILGKFTPQEATRITDAMEHAFATGMHRAFLVPLGFTAVGLVLVWFLKAKKPNTNH